MAALPWTVIGVFDPDDANASFAYTVGLHALGLPEVHLRAVPDRGGDGHWKLSHRDLHYLVNSFASQLRDGDAAIGSSQEHAMDAGMAVVTFTFDPPQPPDTLEAFQTQPGAQVIPIRWQLTLEPEGASQDLTADVEAQQRQRYATQLATLPRAVASTLPAPDTAEWDKDQPFGPLSVRVDAHLHALAVIDPDVVSDFCDYAMVGESGTGPAHVLALCASVARRHGRSDHLAAAQKAGQAVVDTFLEDTDRWGAVSARLEVGDDNAYEHAVQGLLRHATAALVGSTLLDDVLPDDVRAAGQGPWAWATDGALLDAPGPLWLAPESIQQELTTILASADKASVRALDRANNGLLNEPAYWTLRGLLYTSAASCPRPHILAPGTEFATAYAGLLADGMLDVADSVQDAMLLISAALTSRARLAAEHLEAVIGRYGSALPALAPALTKTAEDQRRRD